MEIFKVILLKLLPLYFLVLLGFLATKIFKARKETLASILIYFITPIIILTGIGSADLVLSDLAIPCATFFIATTLCLLYYKFSKLWLKTPARNIVSFAVGNCNSGYFGLPVTIAILGERFTGLAILASFGFVFYENTIGFYVTARGHFSPKESLLKVIRLPSLSAFSVGLLLNYFLKSKGLPFPKWGADFATSFRGAYTVLGMMLIGMAVADVTEFRLNKKFLISTFFGKFLLWPLFTIAILALDRTQLKVFNSNAVSVLLLFSALPLAANTVAYATALRAEPNQAALSVLFSTFVALVFLPLFVALFLPIS